MYFMMYLLFLPKESKMKWEVNARRKNFNFDLIKESYF